MFWAYRILPSSGGTARHPRGPAVRGASLSSPFFFVTPYMPSLWSPINALSPPRGRRTAQASSADPLHSAPACELHRLPERILDRLPQPETLPADYRHVCKFRSFCGSPGWGGDPEGSLSHYHALPRELPLKLLLSHIPRDTRIDARNRSLLDDLHKLPRIAEQCCRGMRGPDPQLPSKRGVGLPAAAQHSSWHPCTNPLFSSPPAKAVPRRSLVRAPNSSASMLNLFRPQESPIGTRFSAASSLPHHKTTGTGPWKSAADHAPADPAGPAQAKRLNSFRHARFLGCHSFGRCLPQWRRRSHEVVRAAHIGGMRGEL
ncbi:hypothetical protein Efla_006977 [Eimeria flavescens]